MASEHARVHASANAWVAPFEETEPSVPVDETLIETAIELPKGRALDLGCGTGQNALWLARRGWVVGGVDIAPEAIDSARAAAESAGVKAIFEVHDITSWRPQFTYDLVISTFALPARGSGRSRMLDMARDAVAPGGTVIVREFDTSLGGEGWTAQRYLVSTEELERTFDGFRINRSAVRLSRHTHGHDQRVLPVATFVATRRTDLRAL